MNKGVWTVSYTHLDVYKRQGTVTRQSESLRAAIACHRDALDAILARYAATNPRIFGSVARGDATPDSDIDLMVDLLPSRGNELPVSYTHLDVYKRQ